MENVTEHLTMSNFLSHYKEMIFIKTSLQQRARKGFVERTYK